MIIQRLKLNTIDKDKLEIVDKIVFLFHAAGGLFTGADEQKTEEERLTYGGLANAILDPCYHQVCHSEKISAVHKNLSHLFQACDTIDNVDEEVYEQMSQCAAYVLEVKTQN